MLCGNTHEDLDGVCLSVCQSVVACNSSIDDDRTLAPMTLKINPF